MAAQDLATSAEQKPVERNGGNGSVARSKLVDAIRRFFLLPDAIQQAKGVEFKPTDAGYAEYLCAKQCMDATKRLEPDSAGTMESIAILRGALHFGLDAWRARRDVKVDRDLAALWSAYLTHTDGEEVSGQLSANHKTLLEQFIESSGLLSVSPLSPAKRTELGELLDTTVERVMGKLDIEALSVSRLRTTRLLRLTVLPAAVLGVLALAGWSLARPNNLALHKSVQLSSAYNPAAYPAAALVDGDKEKLGIHTMDEASPWAQVDLGDSHRISRVVVNNRKDVEGRSYPLHIETSLDGVTYQPFARRDTPYKTWTAKASSRPARYVRLQLKVPSSLQLSEVEIY